MVGTRGRSGRPTKPTKQHLLDGTYRPDRHANRIDCAFESVTDVEPPAYLDERGRGMWYSRLATGYVAAIHLEALESLCFVWQQFGLLESMRAADPINADIRTAYSANFELLLKLGGQFGWSPGTEIQPTGKA